MIKFLARRLLTVLLTLVVSSFLVFAVTEFSPGSVARKSLGMFATDEQVRLLEQKLDLDDPLFVRYGRWIGVLFGLIPNPLGDSTLGLGLTDSRGDQYFGNLGYSIVYKLPVNDVLWPKLANTALLGAAAFAVIVPLAMLFGILAGIKEGSRLDVGLSITGIVLTSLPEFATAVFLVAIFVVLLGWLPGASPLIASPDWSVVQQLVLPILVLTVAVFGYVARIIRSSMIEVMGQPFIRTATLKGMSSSRVVLRHALRNAMIVPVTVILMQINWLMTGVVVTEVVFAYPGFGKMLLEAALYGDIAMIQATTIVALLIVATSQIVSDIAFAWLNPRIRVG